MEIPGRRASEDEKVEVSIPKSDSQSTFDSNCLRNSVTEEFSLGGFPPVIDQLVG